MSSQADRLFALIDRTIEAKDDITQLLSYLPLDNLQTPSFYRLLNRFLQTAFLVDNQDAARDLMSEWRANVPAPGTGINYSLPVYTHLFTMNTVSIDMLQWLKVLEEGYSFYEIITDLIRWDENQVVYLACQRAVDVYGPQDPGRIAMLLSTSVDQVQGNHQVASFLSRYLERSLPYAPVPGWVQDFGSGDIPYEDEIKYPDIDTKRLPQLHQPADEIVSRIFDRFSETGLNMDPAAAEEAKTLLSAQLSVGTAAQRAAILAPIQLAEARDDLAGDRDLFRLLGPVNTIPGTDLTRNDHVCSRYGGCRMLTCIDYEAADDEDDVPYYTDWFRGNCDRCHQKIANRSHSIRFPMPLGGWRGCYCSLVCIRAHIQFLFDEGEVMLVEGNINAIAESLYEWGIQDRKAREEIDRSALIPAFPTVPVVMEPRPGDVIEDEDE